MKLSAALLLAAATLAVALPGGGGDSSYGGEPSGESSPSLSWGGSSSSSKGGDSNSNGNGGYGSDNNGGYGSSNGGYGSDSGGKGSENGGGKGGSNNGGYGGDSGENSKDCSTSTPARTTKTTNSPVWSLPAAETTKSSTKEIKTSASYTWKTSEKATTTKESTTCTTEKTTEKTTVKTESSSKPGWTGVWSMSAYGTPSKETTQSAPAVQSAPSNVPYQPVPHVASTVSIAVGGSATPALVVPTASASKSIPKISQTSSAGPLQVTANAAADTRWSAAAGLVAVLGLVAV